MFHTNFGKRTQKTAAQNTSLLRCVRALASLCRSKVRKNKQSRSAEHKSSAFLFLTLLLQSEARANGPSITSFFCYYPNSLRSPPSQMLFLAIILQLFIRGYTFMLTLFVMTARVKFWLTRLGAHLHFV